MKTIYFNESMLDAEQIQDIEKLGKIEYLDNKKYECKIVVKDKDYEKALYILS